MTRSKISVLIAVVAAMLAVAVAPAVSQAAVKPSKLGTAALVVKPTVKVALDAGSAGIPGYSDARCRSLLEDALKAADVMVQEQAAGTVGSSRYNQAREIGDRAWKDLTDNCLVVY